MIEPIKPIKLKIGGLIHSNTDMIIETLVILKNPHIPPTQIHRSSRSDIPYRHQHRHQH